MTYKVHKSSKKKRRTMPARRKARRQMLSSQQELKELPKIVHDVYADLMDVFYEETDGTFYQQTMRFDDKTNSFVMGSAYQGNVYYEIKQESKLERAKYIVLGSIEQRIRPSIIHPVPQSIINKPIEVFNPKTIQKHQFDNSLTTMAKTNTNGEILKFRGVPITGDAQSFVKLIESKFGFNNFPFKETTVELYGGQFVGEDVQLTVHFSQKSKTVYAVDIDFVSLTHEEEYKHYKSLYTQKYGKPSIIKDDYENDKAVFETETGRIMIYGNLSILYTNTVNEKLAKKEHDLALLDEI